MSVEDNKAVIRRFIDAGLSGRSFEAIEPLLAPDYANYFPGAPSPLKAEGFRAAMAEFFSAFPDMQVEIHDLVGEGDVVAARYTIHATHGGSFQGVPASGNRIAVNGASFYHLKDGKMVDDYPGFDVMSMMQQMGAVPTPGHTSE